MTQFRTGTGGTKLARKVMTLAGVMVLLIGAVAVNIVSKAKQKAALEAESTAAAETASSAAVTLSYFDSFRRERDETREAEIGYIDTIIEQGADAETMADAQSEKLSIVNSMEKEMTMESLLKAKGFSDAAITLHEGSVNVVLSAETLTDEQVAQVLDIIIRESGEKAENIKITTTQS